MRYLCILLACVLPMALGATHLRQPDTLRVIEYDTGGSGITVTVPSRHCNGRHFLLGTGTKNYTIRLPIAAPGLECRVGSITTANFFTRPSVTGSDKIWNTEGVEATVGIRVLGDPGATLSLVGDDTGHWTLKRGFGKLEFYN